MSPQDPATPIMEWMVEFHNFIMCDLLLTSGIVGFFLFVIMTEFISEKNLKPLRSFAHDSDLEISWTLYPTFILLLIAFPSFTLLYALEELIDPALTVKIIGHQWYWSYEYGGSLFSESSLSDSLEVTAGGLQFDSYMVSTQDLGVGRFRLLEVDNRVKLPVKTHIRLLITASDVLHSWAIPSFGIKVDACPGRLSQVNLLIKRCGVFYGQCSEICGVNHGFMPIVVEAIAPTRFIAWALSKGYSASYVRVDSASSQCDGGLGSSGCGTPPLETSSRTPYFVPHVSLNEGSGDLDSGVSEVRFYEAAYNPCNAEESSLKTDTVNSDQESSNNSEDPHSFVSYTPKRKELIELLCIYLLHYTIPPSTELLSFVKLLQSTMPDELLESWGDGEELCRNIEDFLVTHHSEVMGKFIARWGKPKFK